MPIDPKNAQRIQVLQPEFRAQVYSWLNDCRAAGVEPIITEGLRSYQRQRELYARGRTAPGSRVTNAKPGQSYHNFGLAVDAYPRLAGGEPDFDFDPDSPVWRKVVALAKHRGLAWGGDWRSFQDYPHFEMAQAPPLIVCRLRWPRGWSPA